MFGPFARLSFSSTFFIIIYSHTVQTKGSKGMGEGGYVAEFVTDVFTPLVREIAAKNIKVITNAGGV